MIDVARGESNYTAIEWCDNPPLNYLPVVMICRDPISVLNSHLCIQLNHGETFDVDPDY